MQNILVNPDKGAKYQWIKLPSKFILNISEHSKVTENLQHRFRTQQ